MNTGTVNESVHLIWIGIEQLSKLNSKFKAFAPFLIESSTRTIVPYTMIEWKVYTVNENLRKKCHLSFANAGCTGRAILKPRANAFESSAYDMPSQFTRKR